MIGSLEAQVLLTLQRLKKAPARAVLEEFVRHHQPIAYTTVATVLGRLHEKGLVRRTREPCRGGERYVYQAVDFEHKYMVNLLKGVVSLFGPGRRGALERGTREARPVRGARAPATVAAVAGSSWLPCSPR